MKKFMVLVTFLIFTGCATYQPMVDFKTSAQGPDSFPQDLAECQAYAERVSVGQSAVIGAAVGAVLGTAVFAIFGADVGHGAAFGALMGGTQSAAGAGYTQQDIIRRCMISRGYNVLQ